MAIIDPPNKWTWDLYHAEVRFYASSGDRSVRCRVTREAIEDVFGRPPVTGVIEQARRHAHEIEPQLSG